MTGPDPARHVDLDVAAHVEALLTPAPLMRLAGPVAYLRRETVDRRRVDRVNPPARYPLALSSVPRAGRITDVGVVTAVTIDGDVVRAEATMATTDPVGTRYPAGVNLTPARHGTIAGDGDVMVYRDADLRAIHLVDAAAWPDAYLEILGPAGDT